jgi:hypothetical protein
MTTRNKHSELIVNTHEKEAYMNKFSRRNLFLLAAFVVGIAAAGGLNSGGLKARSKI